MRWDTVLFDLDGTLLYTLEDLHASTNFALEGEGLPGRSLDEVRRFVGNGIRKLIERAVPAETSPEVTDRVFAAFVRAIIADKKPPESSAESAEESAPLSPSAANILIATKA